uniref:Uncharacterized protein n=1 Tax=Rhizophora mucronata TaxID=61149 RepID=A0A2P2LNJ9_RHIMU
MRSTSILTFSNHTKNFSPTWRARQWE